MLRFSYHPDSSRSFPRRPPFFPSLPNNLLLIFRRAQKSLLLSFVAASLLQRTVVSRQSSQFAADLGAEAEEERHEEQFCINIPTLFCVRFFCFLHPSHFGHSQQSLLLRFLVDTAAGVCGICPRTPEHVSQISELYNSVIRRKPQIFTCPVVRGDGQTVTCSLGIVVDSKLFANLAPHSSGFLSKMSWRRTLI